MRSLKTVVRGFTGRGASKIALAALMVGLIARSAGAQQNGPYIPSSNQPVAAQQGAAPVDLASAYANSVGAQAAYDQARSDFNVTVMRLNKQFEFSDGYRQAISQCDLAQADVERIRTGLLANVATEPAYQQDLSERDAVAEALADQPKLPERDRVDLALAKMHYAQQARQWENDALGRSDELKSARARLIEANHRVTQMAADFQNNLYLNVTWQSAKRSLDQASLAMITNNAYLHGALQMRADAINAAYLNAQAPRVYSFPDNSGYIGPYPINTGGAPY